MECESGYKLIRKPTGSMTKTTICVAEAAPVLLPPAAETDCFQGKVGPYKHCVQCHPGKDANLGLLGCMECESGYKLVRKPTGSMTRTTICVAESAPVLLPLAAKTTEAASPAPSADCFQ